MALWGISTNAETAANNYALPKFLSDNDRNHHTYNAFADNRGWIYRHYGTTQKSGLSTSYFDEILVPVVGLSTAGAGSSTTGLGLATPVAVFFEDPNGASPISIGAGGTTGIGTGTVGYVHVVFNEEVWASAGATVHVLTSSGANIVATAASAGAPVQVNIPGIGQTVVTFNGQITNRVAFAFTAPVGVGTVLRIDTTRGFIGVITDTSGGVGVTSAFTTDLIRNVGGAGSSAGVGIGTTTLTTKA
jgi:hypothetical protein